MELDFIDKYDMLPPGTSVLCAVSGGADSVYLLCSILDLAPSRGLRVSAAHFNHMLRGAESNRDEVFVKSLCRRLELPCITGRGDVAAYAAQSGLGIEEAARKKRYEFLAEAAEKLGADRIATAHTANDNAETLLLNLTRGAGLKGLGGIPPVRGNIIRPMLLTTRDQVERYLQENRIPNVEDSSNAGDDYARNRIRHRVIPALESVNEGFAENISRAAQLLRADEEYLTGLARDFIEKSGGADGLDAAGLAALPRPLSSRVVRTLTGTSLSEKHVNAVLALAEGSGLGYADLPGLRVTREQGRLRFGGGEGGAIADRRLPVGGSVYLPEADVTVRCALVRYRDEINTSLNTFFFNYANICDILSCTSRKDGDRIRLFGRNCTKNLSDLFSEAKLTQRQRDLTVVIRDAGGVLAVQGFGTAERCAPQPGGTALRIDIEAGEKL